MFAGARNVAFGATIVMAGLFAAMLAERVWVITFLRHRDAPAFFDDLDPWSIMGQWSRNHQGK
jgi:hypothetical protein